MSLVAYRTSEEWRDVEPVPQEDGPAPVVPIAYSPRFVEVMDYFRAMLLSDERSERALQLSLDAIELNPANYTVWYFRRRVLTHLEKDLKDELSFVQEMAHKFPKNYQIWHHRRCIVEELGDASQELDFIAAALKDDAKNYHAWSYRQWVIATFALWGNELAYLDTLLQQDLRNNSAWNQRYFIVTRKGTYKLTHADRLREIEYAFQYIEKAPNNESPWNYLRGVMQNQLFSDYPLVKENCEMLRGSNTQAARSVHLLNLLVDIYAQENTFESKRWAKEILADLAKNVDPIRAAYWNHVEKCLAVK